MLQPQQLYDLWVNLPDSVVFDVMLVAGDGSVHASCYALAAVSPYFRALFDSDQFKKCAATCRRTCVYLHTGHGIRCRADHLRTLVSWMHGGPRQLDDEDAAAVLELGVHLQVPAAVGEVLERQLAPGNAVATYLLARRHTCAPLKQAALRFIGKQLAEVAEHSPVDVLQQLSADQQRRLLRAAPPEVRRTTALLDWAATLRRRGVLCLVPPDDVAPLLQLDLCSPDQLLLLGQHPEGALSRQLQLDVMHRMHTLLVDKQDVVQNLADDFILAPAYACAQLKGRCQVACWRIRGWAAKQAAGEVLTSPEFCIDGMGGWRLACYPAGTDDGSGTHVSLFIFPPVIGAELAYQLFVANQQNPAETRRYRTGLIIFDDESLRGDGWTTMIPLASLAQPGWVVDDSLLVGVYAELLKRPSA